HTRFSRDWSSDVCSSDLGGKVERAHKREFGLAKVVVEQTSGIFHRFARREAIDVWMSHGDRVESMPPGFASIGLSDNTPFCAVEIGRASCRGRVEDAGAV